MIPVDVLIVGAGPTGLILALWLTAQGIKVRVVDQAEGAEETSRAMLVHARTLELYRQLGLADAVVAAGHPNPSINFWVKGKKRAHISFEGAGKDVTPYPFMLVYPQDRHERFLVDQLARKGVQVERRTELLSFDEQGSHIGAKLKTASGDVVYVAARFLAACDGARSTVRRALGTGFPGGTYSQFYYVADVDLSGLAADGQAHIALDQADFLALIPYGQPGQARLIGAMRDEQEEHANKLTFDDVNHRVIKGLELNIEKVNWFSTYRVHHRVAHSFRTGNVFLVGDAAHIHSPVGGQGMNTGIGDAINLAWKLAAVLKQKAPDSLLDSYQVERHAFAEQLVASTDRVFTFVSSSGSLANFVRTQIAPSVISVAYRMKTVREFIFRLVSQTMLSYKDSPLSLGQAGQVHGGDRLPWIKSANQDNFRALESIQWQVHVYGKPSVALTRWCETEQKVPLHIFDWEDHYAKAGLLKDAAYLIRPDSYVALAGTSSNVTELEEYVASRGLDISSE